MTEVWHCPQCKQTFSSMTSYQNHTCNPGTLGGAGDVRSGSQEHITKGGTGEQGKTK